jgi:hypothetical protein
VILTFKQREGEATQNSNGENCFFGDVLANTLQKDS